MSKRASGNAATQSDETRPRLLKLSYTRRVADERGDQGFHIGIYSSRENAEAARARLATQPGFRDDLAGFVIDDVIIDQTEWQADAKSSWGRHSVTLSKKTAERVFRLSFVPTIFSDARDDTLEIGIYSTRENAEAVPLTLAQQPRFRDDPEGFVIDEETVDETNWQEGFDAEFFDGVD